jgi:flagellar basal-body rod protein FlgF
MDSGLYAAYTGLLARTQALDTAANNLANAGTAGFRAQRDYFSGVLAGGVDQDPETASQVGHGVRYTRNGAFSRSPTGVLQTAQGEPVLDANQKPITIPTGSIYVAPDGSISVSTVGGSVIAGQVGAFDFAEKSVLTAEGANRFSANGAKPIPASALIEQGSVEGTNEDAIHGTMQLVLVQRQAEMMQKALSVFNNDFDKTASEDIPRV